MNAARSSSSARPPSTSNSSPPTSGKNANVDTFASVARHEARTFNALTRYVVTPSTAAGVGPSSVIASTTERKVAEMWRFAVSSRNSSLTTDRASRSRKSVIGSQSSRWERAAAAAAEPTVRAICPATSARSVRFTSHVIGRYRRDP